MELKEFLIWLGSSGGNVVIVSWLIERWSWYQSQTKENKDYLFLGFAFLVSVAAFVVLKYVPANILNEMAPYFGMFYVTFSSIFIGKQFHKADKLPKSE